MIGGNSFFCRSFSVLMLFYCTLDCTFVASLWC